MTSEEASTPKVRAPYRPIKQLRAFADALWLVADEDTKTKVYPKIVADGPKGFRIFISAETIDGDHCVVARAYKRNQKPAFLGVLERRQQAAKKYKVRVVLRTVEVEVQAHNKLEAIAAAKEKLSDKKRNPLLKAHYIAKVAS